MSNLLMARSKRVALATSFLIPFAGAALAQSADSRSTADIEKENAALRSKVHRLEAEKENIGLRAKVDQLQGRRPVQAAITESAQGTPYPLVTRIETNSPDRTLVMADMPMKAVAPPVAYYSWTGFYVGGNVGYSVGSDRARSSLSVPANGVVDLSVADTAITPAGGIGGVQLGYNWQGGPNWLVGFEADIQGSSQKATSCIITCASQPGTVTQTLTNTQNLDYFGTVRGRFGFVDRGNLFYVTGGGAYGHVNQTLNLNLVTGGNTPASLIASAATGDNKFGWVVGAGIESSLGGNWTAKVEYLYMDLGSTSTTINAPAPANLLGGAGSNVLLSSTSTIRDNIVRAGLNYRFGPVAGPISAYDAMAAVPPPIYTWTGFYVGANVGYGFGNDRSDISLTTAGQAPIISPPGTSLTPKGGLGGVQIGYNWQASPRWVVGFEADLQGTTMNDTACSSVICYTQSQPSGTVNQIITVQHQLDYFGTVRGRAGYLFNNTLFYGTGGLAFGHVRENLHEVFSAPGATSQLNDFGTSKDLAGYTVGGGIEAALSGGWSVKAEYLYMNLGSISSSFNFDNGGTPATLFSNTTIREHIVRIGANYHIGAAPY
jgi:outer membrane immunogenic protein